MDDVFDKKIKERVKDYSAGEYDPVALSSMHYQMSTEFYDPWYARFRSELLLGSLMVLCTAAILWYGQASGKVESTDDSAAAQSNQIESLAREIQYLKSKPADTIRIVEFRETNPAAYYQLLSRIRSLENLLKESATGSIVRGESVLPLYDFEYRGESMAAGSFNRRRLAVVDRAEESLRAEQNEDVNDATSFKKLSPKTIRDLEKHYQQGVGIRVGPTVDFSNGFFHPGKGIVNAGSGLLADFILSPSLSVETGGIYQKRYYDIQQEDNYEQVSLPGVQSSLGTLKKAEVDSWVVEIPINFKYRYPVSLKFNWVATAGYSSLFYLRQTFEYNYDFDNTDAVVTSIYGSYDQRLYPGSLNLGLGFNKELKNGKILEASLLYRKGIADIGLEQNRADFLGIRGTYWFVVK